MKLDQAPSAVVGRIQLHLPEEAEQLLEGDHRVRVIKYAPEDTLHIKLRLTSAAPGDRWSTPSKTGRCVFAILAP